MAYNNLTREQIFTITYLKEMYESNNRLLTNVTQITNSNFNSDNITSLINNLITSNNEIKHNIMSLLNLNTNNRQNNSNNRHNNSNSSNSNSNNSNSNSNSNNRHNNSNHIQHNYSNRPNYASNRQNYLNNPTISNLFYTFFDPVEIFPTPSQIESATRVVRFGDIVSPLNSSCPISLENFIDNEQVLIIRHCSHIFNNTNLISWFRSSCICPICRYDIRNYVSTNVNNISTLQDVSSNVLLSNLNNVERNPSSAINQLSDLLLNNLFDNQNAHDISGNNLSTNNNLYDISGNLLHFIFTS